MRAWDEHDVENVKGVLTSGSGRDEVCAVTGCEPGDLDRLCRDSFGEPYDAVERRYHAIGVAMVRKAMFEAACAGNAKAAEMFRADGAATAEPARRGGGSTVLELVMADRRAKAERAAG